MYLRDYRYRQGLNQTELGNRFGVRQKTISKFENDPGSGKIDTLFKILAGLGLELILVPREETAREDAATGEW